MCGIWLYLSAKGCDHSLAERCITTLAARGPDDRRICSSPTATLGFSRLSINGLSAEGMQPFSHQGASLVCNGEIYNYKRLSLEYGISLSSGSDCEVLLPLFQRLFADSVSASGRPPVDKKARIALVLNAATQLARALDGVFAIAFIDPASGVVVIARDPYGVRPLYTGVLPDSGRVWASEMKAILPSGTAGAAPFPPGHVGVYDLATGSELALARYHAVPWIKNPAYEEAVVARAHVRSALEAAVEKRLLSDRPIGCLLSGGLDSSLVSALVQRALRARGVTAPLRTFAIGMSAAPGTDLWFARQVATFIGSEHHEVLVSEDEFWSAVPAVIAAIESFDITSVRASVGNYLLAKYISEKTDVKVVLNGDGSDEVAGSYMYFVEAPSDAAFEAEVERLLNDIHMFDVLRSDRCISSHGLEARTPFLDKQFVAVCRAVPTALRRPMRARRGAPGSARAEKQLLREAFDDPNDPVLPPEVLWRRKEAFSDGVSQPGRSWFVAITERVTAALPGDEWVAASAAAYGVGGSTSPYTRESYYYRRIFDEHYAAAHAAIPYFWLPRWCGDAQDPSARTLRAYDDSTNGGDASAATTSAPKSPGSSSGGSVQSQPQSFGSPRRTPAGSPRANGAGLAAAWPLATRTPPLRAGGDTFDGATDTLHDVVTVVDLDAIVAGAGSHC